MRVTHDLIRNNMKKITEEKIRQEEEHQIDMYKEKTKSRFINDSGSVFDMKYDGINTRDSIFDAQAIFKTNR